MRTLRTGWTSAGRLARTSSEARGYLPVSKAASAQTTNDQCPMTNGRRWRRRRGMAVRLVPGGTGPAGFVEDPEEVFEAGAFEEQGGALFVETEEAVEVLADAFG